MPRPEARPMRAPDLQRTLPFRGARCERGEEILHGGETGRDAAEDHSAPPDYAVLNDSSSTDGFGTIAARGGRLLRVYRVLRTSAWRVGRSGVGVRSASGPSR